MKYLSIIFGILFLLSCNEEVTQASTDKTVVQSESKPVNKEDLVQINGDEYIEYYPDGKTIKFKGTQDENKERHGKWVYLSEDGLELSMTMYEHGKKHGHSIVKFPNGTIHYYGEYKNDEKVGVWKTYNEKGELVSELEFPIEK